jgi:exopolyphosphatase/pppGpp-phosphohydrolase
MFPAPDITVADRGLREGMLLRMMRTAQHAPRTQVRHTGRFGGAADAHPGAI